MNEFNASETSTLNGTDDLDMGITEAEVEAIIADDDKFTINDTILEAKEIDTSLSTEEITQRLLKVPEHKMRWTTTILSNESNTHKIWFKMLFAYFRFFGISYVEAISAEDGSFGTGSYAAVHDVEGNK